MRQSHKDLAWPARPNSSGMVISCDEKLGPVGQTGKDHANKEPTHNLFTLVSCTSLFHVVSNTVTLLGVCVCVCVCVCVFSLVKVKWKQLKTGWLQEFTFAQRDR